MLIALLASDEVVGKVDVEGLAQGGLLGVLYADLGMLRLWAGVCAGVAGAMASRMDCSVEKPPTGCELEPGNVAIS